MDKKIFTSEMRDKCRESFPDKAYKQHPTKTFLTTLKAMYVTERLNDVFGIGRWTILTEIIERTNDYVLLQGEFKSLDYDVVLPKQFGGHLTTGKGTEIADGYKSALTDCQSKIASYLEIGIEMFKGNVTVGAKFETPTTEEKPTYVWLSEDQFNSAMKATKEQIANTLAAYNYKTGKAMKKEYKDKLEAKLKTL